jgi:ATP-dependent Lon protease/RNA polymerase subunit RPABC4/transcription elongation factor Spt4
MEKTMEKRNIRTNLLSIVPLRGKVPFPGTVISFDAGRDVTIKALERANATEDKLVFIAAQKVTEKETVVADDIYKIGTVAKIRTSTKLPGGSMRIFAEGLYRAKARNIGFEGGYYYAVTDELPPVHGDMTLEEAYFRATKEMVKDTLLGDAMKLSKDAAARLENCADPDDYVNAVINVMRVRLDVKQEILETVGVVERLRLLERCLNDEAEISKIEKKISSVVRQNIDKSQKEYYLREQLKAIHSELGDDGAEEDAYREKIKAKNLPEEVEKAMDKRTSMGVLGDMNRYTQFQAAEAMREAANNPSGNSMAGMGVGMGAAAMMGQMFTQSMNTFQQPAAPAAQPAGAACAGCGNPVPAGAKFCPNCGQPQTAPKAQFCTGCGSKLEPGAKFCPECGQKQ